MKTSNLYIYLFFLVITTSKTLTMAQISQQFTAIPVSYNVNSSNPIQALDVEYDSEDVSRQAFHIFLPDSTGIHPLVIFIHGGGFTGGTRDIVINTSTGQALP